MVVKKSDMKTIRFFRFAEVFDATKIFDSKKVIDPTKLSPFPKPSRRKKKNDN